MRNGARNRDRRSMRLKNHDYASAASYFVTICTHQRACLFGDVVDNVMRLNEIGEIVKKCWTETPVHFRMVVLDEFQIMPNHLHGIIRIKSHVGTRHAASLQHGRAFGKPDRGSVSTIVGSFKSAVTKTCHSEGFHDFAWQPRFHDRIIRSIRELERIRYYVRNNPLNWPGDEEDPRRPENTIARP